MKKAIYVKCNGEAHSNPYIDHCSICAPYWEEIPTCPECKFMLTKKGICPKCHKMFKVKK